MGRLVCIEELAGGRDRGGARDVFGHDSRLGQAVGGSTYESKKKQGVRDVSSVAARGSVTLTGWATFSGQAMGAATDKKDDSDPQVLADTEGAEMIGADFIYRPENEDFYFRLEVTKIPTLPLGIGGGATVGSDQVLYGLRFSAGGKEFQIRAHKSGGVQPGNPTGPYFGLFVCGQPPADEGTCLEIAPLKGGYGTTGERIVVALPLEVLREAGEIKLKEGDQIGGLYAFAAQGAYLLPPVAIWDDAQLIKQASVPIPEKSVRVTVGKKTVTADLQDGYFKATFPGSLFKGSTTTVKTKTCLGKVCKSQTFKVKK
jgi:hypothetical protein